MVPEVTNETIEGALSTFRPENVDILIEDFKNTQPHIYNTINKEYKDTPAMALALSSALTTWYLIKRQMEINELYE